MLIRDLLKQYKVEFDGHDINKYFEDIKRKNKALEKDMKKIAPQYPALQFFIFILEEIRNKGWCYKNFVELLEDYKVNTIKDFLEFNEMIQKFNISQIIKDTGLTILLDFKDKYNKYEEINYSDLLHRLNKLISKDYKQDTLKIDLKDKVYRIPDLNDIKKFLSDSIINKLTYYSERRDCDGFASMLKCELERCGVGNLTIGYCEVDLYKKENSGLYGAHALNLMLCKDKGKEMIKFIEPQTDYIFDIGNIIINTKYYKIRKLSF